MSHEVRLGAAIDPPPKVSIVTTVYNRTQCLQRCLRAMRHSTWTDWEQIVVSDAPGPKLEQDIQQTIEALHDPRLRYLALTSRANDWGMTPAWTGLRAAVGQYVAFLSDDNAYLPEHLAPLVKRLDTESELGFVYTSCQYAGRRVLDVSPPRGANIDLGQPLFRRAMLERAFPEGWPWHEHAWDWRLIHVLLEQNVPWAHSRAQTFVFKLEKYPQYLRALA